MRYFPIKKLEQFSGIMAHTIRVWEKRYQIFQPERKGSVRYYKMADVKLLLNLSILVNNGVRISKLVKLSHSDIESKVHSLTSELAISGRTINSLIMSMYSGEIEAFEKGLDQCIEAINLNNTIEQIIIPFLARIQLLSYNDTSSDAHFVVTVLRKKLILGIENIRQKAALPETTLLFLPEGEHYDLLLLYHTYKLKQKGYRTLYLGTNIAPNDFETALRQKKPDYICTYITDSYDADLKKYFRVLENVLPKTKMLIAQEKMSPTASVSNIKTIYSSYNTLSLYK